MTVSGTILLICPDANRRRALSDILISAGYCVDAFATLPATREDEGGWTLAVADLADGLPTVSLSSLRQKHPDLQVLALVPTAEIPPLHEIADDHLVKPWSEQMLLNRIRRMVEWQRLMVENRSLRRQVAAENGKLSSHLETEDQPRDLDADLLAAVADPATLAFEEVQLLLQLQQQYDELDALCQVSQAMSATLELDSLLMLIMDAIIKLTKAERGAIMLRDDDDKLNLTVARNLDSETLDQQSFHLSLSVIERVSRQGEPVLTSDAHEDPRFANSDSVVSHGLRSIMCVPLKVRGSTIGVAYVDNRLRAGAFTSKHLNTLQTFASQAAVAIENARLFQQLSQTLNELQSTLDAQVRLMKILQRRNLQLETSNEVSQRITLALALEDLLSQLVHLIQERLSLYHVHVYLLDAQAQVLTVRESTGEPGRIMKEKGHSLPIRTGIAGHVATTAEPYLATDISTCPYFKPNPLLPDTRSELAVPLVVGNRVVGVLDMQSDQVGGVTEDDMMLFQSLGRQIGMAIENTRLIERMVQERHHMAHVLNSIADGVFTVDRDLCIQTFNRAAGQITGWPPEEAIGQLCCQVLATQEGKTEGCEEVSCPVADALQGQTVQGSYRTEREIVSRDGRALFISSNATPLFDLDRQPSGAVVVFRDVSAEKEVERLRNEFVSMVSHELRSPMTNIQTSVELMLTSDLGSEVQSEVLGIVKTQVQRLSSFVEEMLDLSLIEAGQIVIHREPVTLQPLIRRTVSAFEAAGTQGHHFVIGDTKTPFVWADEGKVEVILTNLLANAVNYSPRGSEIVVESASDPETNMVVTSVTDQGIGIAPEHHERIFDQFYCINSDKRSGSKGRGLGLYISRCLVELQGGRIWVESEEGEGSCFSFALPKMEDKVEGNHTDH